MCALFVVSSQRWRCHTNAVTVRARYLPCFVATLVLYVHVICPVLSQRWCCMCTLFPQGVGPVRKTSLCMCTLFPQGVGPVRKTSLCMCTLFPQGVGPVRKTSLCMCTLFAPSWCSEKTVSVCARYLLQAGAQKNQSLYVHVICSKLVLRKNSLCMYTLFVPSWCSDKPVSVCARYFLKALVLSEKPVSVCARYLLQAGAQKNQSLYVHVICSKLVLR